MREREREREIICTNQCPFPFSALEMANKRRWFECNCSMGINKTPIWCPCPLTGEWSSLLRKWIKMKLKYRKPLLKDNSKAIWDWILFLFIEIWKNIPPYFVITCSNLINSTHIALQYYWLLNEKHNLVVLFTVFLKNKCLSVLVYKLYI